MNKKNQKPIEIDASFKYICPNNNCEIIHWLFLRQTQTKNFKVVCECGMVFKPKQIKNLKIVFTQPKFNDKKSFNSTNDVPKCVSMAINTMITLGYSKDQSQQYIDMIYKSEQIDDYKILVKKAISKIGGI